MHRVSFKFLSSEVVELALTALLPILKVTLWASFNPCGLIFWLLKCFTNAKYAEQFPPRAEVRVISRLRKYKKKVSLDVLRADQRRRWFELMYPNWKTSARRNRQRKNGKLARATNAALRKLIYVNISGGRASDLAGHSADNIAQATLLSLPACISAPCSFMPHGDETASRGCYAEQNTEKRVPPCFCGADASELVISESGGLVQGAEPTIVDDIICDEPYGVGSTCRSLVDAESVRGSDQQREAKADGSPRLMPTSDQQQQMTAMQERAPRLLLTCTAQRNAARILLLVLYSCLLRCFSCAGMAVATSLAYILTFLASQKLSLTHGPWCRLATTVSAGAPVAHVWNMHLGACVFIVVMSLPSPWLWWAPKLSENALMERLLMAEQWAEANLGELHLRDGKCFQGKLRQLNGGVEKSIYLYLHNHMTRIKESAVLAAQLAKLDSMVESQCVNAALSSGVPGSSKVRSSTDAGLSTQDEVKKRRGKRGQTGSAGRIGSCGSTAASNPDLPMNKESMVWHTGTMDSAVTLSTSSESGQASGSSNAATISSIGDAVTEKAHHDFDVMDVIGRFGPPADVDPEALPAAMDNFPLCHLSPPMTYLSLGIHKDPRVRGGPVKIP